MSVFSKIGKGIGHAEKKVARAGKKVGEGVAGAEQDVAKGIAEGSGSGGRTEAASEPSPEEVERVEEIVDRIERDGLG